MKQRSVLRTVLGSLILAATAMAPRVARAQATTIVKPEFLLIVDTSGSMVTATGSANSCGYVDTRQNSAACVVRNLADGIGDAIFGLATYGLQCSAAGPYHYLATPAQGCGGAAGSTCITTFPAAIPAMGNPAANGGFPFPFYGCNDGGTLWVPPNESLQYHLRNFGDASFTACATFPASPGVGGPELSAFAAGFNPTLDRDTPLAGSLYAMARYIRNQNPAQTSPYLNFDGTGLPDPYPSCRPLNIILLTDGAECCDDPILGEDCTGTNTPIGAAINARNIGCMQIDLNGNGVLDNPIPASDPNPALRGRFEGNIDLNNDGDCYDANEQRAFKTHVYVIGFGIACGDTSIETIGQAGGAPLHSVACGATTRSLYGYYANNESEISRALNSIVSQSALREVCNGLDDNCNGQIDEDFLVGPRAVACTVGLGACRRTGSTVCNAVGDGVMCSVTAGSPSPENTAVTCSDGIDNDCDGFTDCGDVDCATQPSCIASCMPTPEVCDGRDNNCNGMVDEGGITRPCGSGIGACTLGTQTCLPQTAPGTSIAMWGACTGSTGSPEVCDGIDNNCNGVADEGLSRACGSAVGECRAGVQLCVGGMYSGPCIGSVGPTSEVCDGLDNDCDGTADNGIASPGPCGASGIGICTTGTIQCLSGTLQCVGGTAARPEVCNGIDDDCNGVIDDGLPSVPCTPPGITFPTMPPMGVCRQGMSACRGGMLVCDGAVGPGTEVCNGLDDNCNGMIDEGLTGTPCGTSVGTCHPGVTSCAMGRMVCVGATLPTMEVCNGLDDNCNGMVDEGNPGGGAACGSAIGECVPGVLECTGGMLVCVGSRGPMPETCNGLDDDCNGMVDDGIADGGPCGSNVGECRQGTSRCIAGHTSCVGGVGPHPEECNCRDDDCDGTIDNQATGGAQLCGGGSVCAGAPYCQCLRPCENTEFPCPIGRTCASVAGQNLCVGDLCASVMCNDATERCLNGACHSRCEGVSCTTPLVCNPRTGLCVDNSCRVLANCQAGQICRGDQCIADPCAGLSCAANEACYNGTCGASCAATTCPAGQMCAQGQCVPADACAGVTCAASQACAIATGTCGPNPCMDRACGDGQACNPQNGLCEDDPCAIVRCPSGQQCLRGDCRLPAVMTAPRDRVIASGGGGASCNAGPAPGSARTSVFRMLAALGFVAVLARRRRR